MGKLDEIKQRVEGKADEFVGEMQQQSGQGVKGGFTKVKGKMKQATASFHDTDHDSERDGVR